MFGEPAEIEDHAGGGNYVRPNYEGGGSTNTYPFQIWRYRHIDGVGDDVEIRVRRSILDGPLQDGYGSVGKGHAPQRGRNGQTLGERLGQTKRATGPGYIPVSTASPPRWPGTVCVPRICHSTHAAVLQPAEASRGPAQGSADHRGDPCHLQYLPFRYALTYIRADSERVFVPITLEVETRD